MAKTKPEGLMTCPECGFPDAEIKKAKSGMLYRWCPECNAQYFARDAVTSARLGEKARAGTGPAAEESKQADPVPVPEKPARRGFDLGAL